MALSAAVVELSSLPPIEQDSGTVRPALAALMYSYPLTCPRDRPTGSAQTDPRQFRAKELHGSTAGKPGRLGENACI